MLEKLVKPKRLKLGFSQLRSECDSAYLMHFLITCEWLLPLLTLLQDQASRKQDQSSCNGRCSESHFSTWNCLLVVRTRITRIHQNPIGLSARCHQYSLYTPCAHPVFIREASMPPSQSPRDALLQVLQLLGSGDVMGRQMSSNVVRNLRGSVSLPWRALSAITVNTVLNTVNTVNCSQNLKAVASEATALQAPFLQPLLTEMG